MRLHLITSLNKTKKNRIALEWYECMILRLPCQSTLLTSSPASEPNGALRRGCPTRKDKALHVICKHTCVLERTHAMGCALPQKSKERVPLVANCRGAVPRVSIPLLQKGGEPDFYCKLFDRPTLQQIPTTPLDNGGQESDQAGKDAPGTTSASKRFPSEKRQFKQHYRRTTEASLVRSLQTVAFQRLRKGKGLGLAAFERHDGLPRGA